MFRERYDKDKLSELLLPKKEYNPYPKAEQRKEWEELPGDLKKSLINEAEKYLNFEWPSLPAVRFMDFTRDGNRSRYEALHFKRRNVLALLIIAECIEYKGRFLDDIINGIWAICEESFWGVPAHNHTPSNRREPLPDVTEPIIDLFAAETAGLLSWAYYLLKLELDKVTPLICKRILLETEYRILDPFLSRNDFWWLGFNSNRKVNNWNPWIHSNCLIAFLLLEEDHNRMVEAVYKAMNSLDRFLDVYHPDGGCDEGTSYWGRAGASLFDCLELLYSASNGHINFYDEPIIKEIGRFIYRSYISGDYFINFADGGAKVQIASDLVYRYGKRIGDSKLMAMGSSAHHAHKGQGVHISCLLRDLPAIFNYAEIEKAPSEPPYVRDVWLNGIQVMAAREQEGSDKGLYLAAKGGHNDESHNHNDVGQFIIYADGKPVLIDIGVETYIAKTFSPQRYEIWTMQSAYHNLPTINGIQQAPGERYKASKVSYVMDEYKAELSLDISTAYPEEAGIKFWNRICRLNRGEKALIEIIDDFGLNKPSDIMLTLMTPCLPVLDRGGEIVLEYQEGCRVQIEYDNDSLAASYECIPVKDARLTPVWGERVYRILLKAKTQANQGKWVLKVSAAK